jgi:malonate decarboxylase delta subunit
MEKLEFQYSAGAPAASRVMVGVVGSGDLEVLVEPAAAGRTTVRITTSVDGYASVWQAQLDRVFKGDVIGSGGPAVEIEINDFGATPGVVGMRIAQAFQAIGKPAGASS